MLISQELIVYQERTKEKLALGFCVVKGLHQPAPPEQTAASGCYQSDVEGVLF